MVSVWYDRVHSVDVVHFPFFLICSFLHSHSHTSAPTLSWGWRAMNHRSPTCMRCLHVLLHDFFMRHAYFQHSTRDSRVEKATSQGWHSFIECCEVGTMFWCVFCVFLCSLVVWLSMLGPGLHVMSCHTSQHTHNLTLSTSSITQSSKLVLSPVFVEDMRSGNSNISNDRPCC